MTIAVDLGHKATKQNKKFNILQFDQHKTSFMLVELQVITSFMLQVITSFMLVKLQAMADDKLLARW